MRHEVEDNEGVKVESRLKKGLSRPSFNRSFAWVAECWIHSLLDGRTFLNDTVLTLGKRLAVGLRRKDRDRIDCGEGGKEGRVIGRGHGRLAYRVAELLC